MKTATPLLRYLATTKLPQWIELMLPILSRLLAQVDGRLHSRWVIAILACALTAVHFAYFPAVLAVSGRAFSADYVWRHGVMTVAIVAIAFWMGLHSQNHWQRLRSVPAWVWFLAAVLATMIPIEKGWRAANGVAVWHLPFMTYSVSAGLLSSFLMAAAGFALRNTQYPRPSLSWPSSAWFSAAVLTSLLLMLTAGDMLPTVVVAGLLPWALFRTVWWRASLTSAMLFFSGFALYLLGDTWRFDRLVAGLFPLNDPQGLGWSSHQVRHAIAVTHDAALLKIAGATDHFFLATLTHLLGHSAAVAIVAVTVLLLVLLWIRAMRQPTGSKRDFSLMLLVFISISTAINLFANTGFLSYSGRGLAFLSGSLCTCLSALVMGLTWKNAEIPIIRLPKATRARAICNLSRAASSLVFAINTTALLTFVYWVLLQSASDVWEAQSRAKAWTPRATIIDRQGVVLATNEPRHLVWVDQQQFLMAKGDVLVKLARATGIKAEQLISRLSSTGTNPSRHLNLAYNLTTAQSNAVSDLFLYGVYLEPMDTRVYPVGPLAAHVVGLVTADRDTKGLEGAELQFDESIKKQRIYDSVLSPDRGPLRLSIDSEMQLFVRDALQQAMVQSGATSATAMVTHVFGDIRAMVSLPEFNPNPESRSELNLDDINNLALTDGFRPPPGLLEPLQSALNLTKNGLGPSAARKMNDFQLIRLGFGQPRMVAGLGTSLAQSESFSTTGLLDILESHIESASPVQMLAAYTALHLGYVAPLSIYDASSSAYHSSTDSGSSARVFGPEDLTTIGEAMTHKALGQNKEQSRAELGGGSAVWQSIEHGRTVARDMFVGLAPISSPQFAVMVMLKREGKPIAGQLGTRTAEKIAERVMKE